MISARIVVYLLFRFASILLVDAYRTGTVCSSGRISWNGPMSGDNPLRKNHSDLLFVRVRAGIVEEEQKREFWVGASMPTQRNEKYIEIIIPRIFRYTLSFHEEHCNGKKGKIKNTAYFQSPRKNTASRARVRSL